MKIIKLKAENVKRLRAVEVTPAGSVVTITGKNGEGKTSLLDSIVYAIGGKKFIPAEPIRRGERTAEIEVDLGDLVIKRRFKGENTYLEVTNKDGAVQKSPQSILDKLKGAVGFDAVEFSRLKSDKQLETLKSLVGLDFADLDNRRQAAYDNRTNVNRDLKTAEARLKALPYHDDAPDGEVSVTELARDLEARQLQNAENAEVRSALRGKSSEVELCKQQIAETEKEIARLEAERDREKERLKACSESAERLTAEVDKLEDRDVEEIRTKIAGAEDANRKVRENKTRETIAEEVDLLTAKSGSYTTAIDAVDAEKKAMVAAAKMPVENLGLGECGVELNGLPLDQASSAEQLRVSVAIGLALNPTLRVLTIENGSLLDETSMKMVAEMASDADSQLWVEVVDSDDPSAVIIEDGMVKSDVSDDDDPDPLAEARRMGAAEETDES
jgi:DNA repair exonuclease SbcCD ATPase subunit